MHDDKWQNWLKDQLSTEEWDQHIRCVRTILKTNDKHVVEIVRAVDTNNFISLGYFRLTLKGVA
jgi:hypothetical protein